MQRYVEEMGETSLCSVPSESGCGDKQKKFIKLWKEKSQADVEKQLTRLRNMDGSAMKPELNTWRVQRLSILKQLKSSEKKEL